jgi:hypothetical protein
MENESGVTRVQVSQNARGEFQLDVKVFPQPNLPGHPDLGAIFRDVAELYASRLAAAASQAERALIVQEMNVAVNSAVAEKITNERDLFNRATEKAIAELPRKVAELAHETAGELVKRGYKVAGGLGLPLDAFLPKAAA